MDNLWPLTQRNRIDKFLAFPKSVGLFGGRKGALATLLETWKLERNWAAFVALAKLK